MERDGSLARVTPSTRTKKTTATGTPLTVSFVIAGLQRPARVTLHLDLTKTNKLGDLFFGAA